MKKIKTKKDFDTQLRDKTLELLRGRPRTIYLTQIERDTGIPETWLRAFGQKRVDNPGANTVETLYNYLSGRQLKV